MIKTIFLFLISFSFISLESLAMEEHERGIKRKGDRDKNRTPMKKRKIERPANAPLTIETNVPQSTFKVPEIPDRIKFKARKAPSRKFSTNSGNPQGGDKKVDQPKTLVPVLSKTPEETPIDVKMIFLSLSESPPGKTECELYHPEATQYTNEFRNTNKEKHGIGQKPKNILFIPTENQQEIHDVIFKEVLNLDK